MYKLVIISGEVRTLQRVLADNYPI